MIGTIKDCLKNAMHNKVMVIGIILIPFLYAILYVNAFWDPVGQLKDMTIAVVNLDEGATLSGEAVNYGDTIIDNIKDDDTVKWKEVDPEVFQNGIENTDYYMAFVINKDFSKDVVAASDGDPKQGEITYMVDKRKNFVISQYGNMIKTSFNDTVSESITKEYTETIYNGLKDMSESLDEAVSGSTELDDGVKEASSGVGKLKNGADKVAGGLNTLSDSLHEVNKKMPQLTGGINRLSGGVATAKTGSSALNNGMSSLEGFMPALVNGADTLSSSLAEAGSSVSALSSGLSSASGNVSKIADSASSLSSAADASASAVNGEIDAAINMISAGDYEGAIGQLESAKATSSASADKISDSLSTVAGNLDAVAGGLQTTADQVSSMTGELDLLAKGASSLSGNLQKLSGNVSLLSGVSSKLDSGIDQISSGVSSLSSNVSMLSSGSSELASGASTLSNGANQLSSGLATLETGMFTLTEGTGTLSEGLSDGAVELKDSTASSTKEMADFVSKPVKSDDESYGNAQSYGMGFSPFFISLSCWLGAVLLFFVVPVRPKNPLRASRMETVFGPMPIFVGVSVLQSVFISIGTLIVGVNVNNIPLLFVMTMLMSVAFALFIQFLSLGFGLSGRGLSIIILIFQLCACGGTFPVELISRFFQIISPFMPFTYSVKALKEIMFGGDMSIILINGAVIIGFGLVSLLLSLASYRHGLKYDKVAEA